MVPACTRTSTINGGRNRRSARAGELRQILDLTPLHITEFGPDGSRLYMNRAALDFHGLTLEEWQGAELHTLFIQKMRNG